MAFDICAQLRLDGMIFLNEENFLILVAINIQLAVCLCISRKHTGKSKFHNFNINCQVLHTSTRKLWQTNLKSKQRLFALWTYIKAFFIDKDTLLKVINHSQNKPKCAPFASLTPMLCIHLSIFFAHYQTNLHGRHPQRP